MSVKPPEPATMDWTAARACLGPDGLLSVVMPVYNLAEEVAANLRRVHAALSGNIPFELIPVDDGSGDQSAAALRAMAAELPCIQPAFLTTNAGKGAALRLGVDQSRGSYVLLLDGDLDLPPEPVARFFEILQATRADVVIGSKMHPGSVIDYPWQRRVASRVYYGMVKCLMGLPVRDTQTGMKLFRRGALQHAFGRMLAKRFAFDLEVLAIAHRAGYRIAEAPVSMRFGEKIGCLTPRNIAQTMLDTLAVFYRLRILRYYDRLVVLDAPATPPSVTVLIACPGPSAALDSCLGGLARQDYPDLEAILLPDAPTGRTWPPWVRELPTGPARPAEKRNRGIDAARGTLVALLDDDATPLPGWLDRAVRHFSDPDLAGVGGPATTPPDASYWSRLGGRVFANPLVSGSARRRYVPTRVRWDDDIPSCNLILRTSVLRRLGGFDTRHWPGEDTLLCLRIVHELDLRLLYDPWVQVLHRRRPLFGPHLRQVGRYALHRGVFFRRFPQTSRRLSYLLPSLWLVGLVAGLAAACAFPPLAPVWVAAVAVYLGLVVVSSAHLLRPDLWWWTACGVVATHVVYGARFLQGLLTGRTPEAVRSFDHTGAADQPPEADNPPTS